VFNGTITNTTFFKTGDSVKITYQPNRGYELDSILVNGVKLNDSTNSYTFRNLDSTQNIVVVYKLSVQLISSNKAIFKANDTMVLRGRNLYKIELKTIANQNPQYVPKLDLVTNIIGSRDSLYSFIIPTNLQNTVYKLRGINTILNDTSFNTFVIRVSNNFDSLGIIGWGENTNNQAIIPKSITNIVQIGVGPIHNLALKFDGTVVGSGGSNTYGERTIPTGLDKVVQVVAGGYYSLALKSDGSVIVWGQNSTGLNSVPTGLNNVVQLAVGLDQNLALKSDGSVISWGSNSFGKATVPLGLNNAIQVAAGWDFSLALKSDGSVVAWGNNDRGQIDIPGNAINIVQIAAGNYYTLALKSDGSVIVWGYGMTNLNRVPDGLSNVKQITAGFSLNLALKNNDSLVLWGGNTFKQSIIPTGLNNVVDISCGPLSSHSFAMYKLAVKTKVVNGIISNQTFFKKGDSVKITYLPNRGYQLDSIVVNGRKLNDSTNSYTFRNIDSTQNIAAAFKAIPVRLISINKSIVKANDTLVLRAINLSKIELKTLNNQNIQYINRLDSVDDISGSNESIYRFIIPTNLQNTVYKIKGINTIANDTSINTFVIRVSNNSDSLAIIGWGKNDANQINVPKGIVSIVQVAEGLNYTLALKSDGTVVGWGDNSSGKSTAPADLTNVVQVAAGASHSAALKSDGTVRVWGYNGLGQTNIPSGLTNIVQISTGANHTLALKSDGTAVAWGYDGAGQSIIPNGLNNVVQLAAGYVFSLALKSDGTVVGWGNNSNGQTTIPGNATNVAQIAAGGYHSIAFKADSTAVAWGLNTSGQALNTGNTKFKQISAGSNFSLSLILNNTVAVAGDNTYGQRTTPASLNNVVDVSSGPTADHIFAIYKLAVKTQVFNGTITNTTFFKRGDSVRITYQHHRGNLLDSVVVNGVKVNDSTNSYTFRNIDSTQNIVVYYRVLPIKLDSIYKAIYKANDTV
ncbi:MAG: hypothetical protein ORN85_09480, partial [Sediminibacterium sp.]|nr:hypothetical protein [Sediminibacterium sp.]